MKRSNAIDQSAALNSPPSIAPPISEAIAAVRLFVGASRLLGKAFIFPMTIATASASPNARASPSTIAVKIPGSAAGSNTR